MANRNVLVNKAKEIHVKHTTSLKIITKMLQQVWEMTPQIEGLQRVTRFAASMKYGYEK